MPLVQSQELLSDARKNGYAVGAFNVFNQLMARAVIQASEEMNAPVIIQTAVSAVKWYGPAEMIGFLAPLAKCSSVPVVIHLDHCPDPDFAKGCMDAGWNSIMIDASKRPLEENIAISRDVAAYGHRRGISVEGEFGVIVGVEDSLSVDDSAGVLANQTGSAAYVAQSGVDAFAPAIGTAHGMYKSTPRLNYTLLEELRKTIPVPLVLHGGTGLEEEVFKRLIRQGISKVNVATALKQVYIDSIREAAGQFTEPLQADQLTCRNLVNSVKDFIRIFGSAGKA